MKAAKVAPSCSRDSVRGSVGSLGIVGWKSCGEIFSHAAPEKLLRCGSAKSVGSCRASVSFHRLVPRENFGVAIGWKLRAGGGFPSQNKAANCAANTSATAIHIPGRICRDFVLVLFASPGSAAVPVMDVGRMGRANQTRAEA